MICRRLLGLLAMVVLICPAMARAQEWEESRIAELRQLLAGVGLDTLSAADIGAKLKEAIGNPETLNKVLLRLQESPEERWRFLKDLHLQFKSFNASESDAVGLGLAYQYVKDIKRQELSESAASQKGLTFSFAADGNVAFDQSINPRDFLDSRLDFAFFRSAGGAVVGNPTVFERLNALELSMAGETDEAALNRSPEWREFYQTVQNALTTQTYLDVGVTVSLESNQSFSETQWVYCGQAGFDVKAWNHGALLSQWNLFDWPFALVRLLDGVDEKFTPRGSTIPTVIAGVDWVDPEKNPAREALGEMAGYPRVRVESAFKTLVAQEGERNVFFLAEFRYYGELDAPGAIKTADLAEFIYFTSALTIGESLFVSYSDGRLPFDAVDDRVYELGFQVVF